MALTARKKLVLFIPKLSEREHLTMTDDKLKFKEVKSKEERRDIY